MKEEIIRKLIDTNKNVVVEGGVATGKTKCVFFPMILEMINKKESLLILDPKEEYLKQYYDKLKMNDYNIVIVNLRDTKKSEGWNPLEYPYNLYKNGEYDRALESVEKIFKEIFYEGDDGIDPFWGNTASDLLTGIALGLFMDASLEEVNISSICNMMSGIEKKFGATDYLTEYFNLKEETSAPYVYASSTILAPKDTRGGIVSVAREKMMLYRVRKGLNNLLNKTTFDINGINDKPTAIFIIGRDEDKSVNCLASMFIEQLYMILISKENKSKFNFILDNLDILEHCNELENMMSSCFARNIKFYLGTRSWKRIVNNYSKYLDDLCDFAFVGKGKIKLSDSHEEEKIEFCDRLTSENNNIEYPILSESNVKLFDLKEYVSENKKKSLIASLPSSSTDFLENDEMLGKFNNLDEAIADIDRKIAELEKLEITSEK